MAKPTKLFSLCSLSMASLFAYSASVQLNDPDWYFWFPLYAFASTVNLFNCISPSKIVNKVANTALWLGVFLFVKVVIEDFMFELAGFWSLDLRKRVVREKIGSGLVVISMFLQLMKGSTDSMERLKKKKSGATVKWVEYGTLLLVGFSHGLPVVFYVAEGRLINL
ncbi:hypothetical protein Sjap_016832 [Stephania japonica]|uniref:Transmembrane protein 220 n=1 Tax=Stephania japonica TaxID=461633 RepID=A0AAP0NHQ9_9MAGN